MSWKLMDKLLVISSEGIIRGKLTRTYIDHKDMLYVIITDLGAFHISSKGMLTHVATDCSDE